MPKEGKRGQSHSKGYHKKIIVDNPNADVKLVSKPLVLDDKMRYTLELAWDGKTASAIIREMKTMDKLASVELVRYLLDQMRKACRMSLDDGKPLKHSVAETHEYIDHLMNIEREILKPLSIEFAATVINDQAGAEKPVMAIVTDNEKNGNKN